MKKFKEKMETRVKPTKGQMARYLDIVEDLIIKGCRTTEIWQYLTQNVLKLRYISRRTAERYCQLVNKKWDAVKIPHREREIKKAIKRYESLIAKSIMINDYRTAAGIQGKLCELLGLNKPQKIEAEITEKPAIDYTKLSTPELKELKSLLIKAKPEKEEK